MVSPSFRRNFSCVEAHMACNVGNLAPALLTVPCKSPCVYRACTIFPRINVLAYPTSFDHNYLATCDRAAESRASAF